MARPYWSGQIQISLVSFGVKLFVATESKSEIRFHQISRKTGERVKHQKVLSSAGFGYTIQRSIGYGYVRHPGGVTTQYVLGGTYELEVATERVPCEVSLQPFYDPRSERVRLGVDDLELFLDADREIVRHGWHSSRFTLAVEPARRRQSAALRS